jgi:hypothetical protein
VHTRVAGDRDALAFGLQATGDAARASPSSSAGGHAISGNFNLARPTARTRSPPTQEDLRDFCRIAAEHDSLEAWSLRWWRCAPTATTRGLCGTPPGRLRQRRVTDRVPQSADAVSPTCVLRLWPLNAASSEQTPTRWYLVVCPQLQIATLSR